MGGCPYATRLGNAYARKWMDAGILSLCLCLAEQILHGPSLGGFIIPIVHIKHFLLHTVNISIISAQFSSPKLEVPSLLPFWCTWLVKGLKSHYRNMDTHSSQAGATDKTSAYNEPCWKVFPLALNLQHYSVMWRINIILKPCTYFLQDQGSRLICTAILLKFLKSLFNTWASKLVDFR